MARKLTPQQMKFTEEFLRTGNRVQAAIAAGYSQKSADTRASKLLANPAVQEYRKKLAEEHVRQLGIDESWMTAQLHAVITKSLEPESWNPTGAVRAIHELRSLLGMDEEKQESGTTSFEQWLEKMGEGTL